MKEILGKKYITEKEASQKFGFSTDWFRRQRYLKKPPPFTKLQGRILYDLDKLNDWFNKQLIEKDFI